MNTVATIEARMASSRLPGKVLLPVLGRPLLDLMIERVRYSSGVDRIVVATTENPKDDAIEALAHSVGVGCFRGSEQDVMCRVLGAAQAFDADLLIELTGDCPLIDPSLIDEVISQHVASGADYTSNIHEGDRYPLGMAVQAFSTAVLADAAGRTEDVQDREHVSYYIYRNPDRYCLCYVVAPPHLTDPELRLTVDEREDYELVSTIIRALYPVSPRFGLKEILNILAEQPHLREINAHIEQRILDL